MKQHTIPGLKFIEFTKDPRVNNGAPTPLYEFAEPKDGRLSINTLEGWNALADRLAARATTVSPRVEVAQ